MTNEEKPDVPLHDQGIMTEESTNAFSDRLGEIPDIGEEGGPVWTEFDPAKDGIVVDKLKKIFAEGPPGEKKGGAEE